VSTYLTNRLWEFHQIYFGAAGDKHEMIWLWGRS